MKKKMLNFNEWITLNEQSKEKEGKEEEKKGSEEQDKGDEDVEDEDPDRTRRSIIKEL